MKQLSNRVGLVALLLSASSIGWAQAPAINPGAQPLPTTSSQGGGASGTAEFRYPESTSTPSSSLRMREIPQTDGWGRAGAPRPVTNTPESLELYRQCQRAADREATGIADMQGRIAGCLQALNVRREQGQ